MSKAMTMKELGDLLNHVRLDAAGGQSERMES